MSNFNEDKQIDKFNEGEQAEYEDENIARYETFETELLKAENAIDSTETMDTNIGNDFNVNGEENVNTGSHVYGETVSKTISSLEMYDFMLNILIQASLGNLPKSSPEEVRQLLLERFDTTLAKNVESELPEQPAPPIEDHSEQLVRNQLKRQRVDSDV